MSAFANGVGTQAVFSKSGGFYTIDNANHGLYVADTGFNRIRRIELSSMADAAAAQLRFNAAKAELEAAAAATGWRFGGNPLPSAEGKRYLSFGVPLRKR
jgi:hypothetical protein